MFRFLRILTALKPMTHEEANFCAEAGRAIAKDDLETAIRYFLSAATCSKGEMRGEVKKPLATCLIKDALRKTNKAVEQANLSKNGIEVQRDQLWTTILFERLASSWNPQPGQDCAMSGSHLEATRFRCRRCGSNVSVRFNPLWDEPVCPRCDRLAVHINTPEVCQLCRGPFAGKESDSGAGIAESQQTMLRPPKGRGAIVVCGTCARKIEKGLESLERSREPSDEVVRLLQFAEQELAMSLDLDSTNAQAKELLSTVQTHMSTLGVESNPEMRSLPAYSTTPPVLRSFTDPVSKKALSFYAVLGQTTFFDKESGQKINCYCEAGRFFRYEGGTRVYLD